MRATVQRVRRASVTVEGAVVSQIGPGLLVYIGCARGDEQGDAEYVAAKVAGLRIFPDDEGKMNRSVADVHGEVLVVSAFTLQADARKGRRPSFDLAAPPEEAQSLCEAVVRRLQTAGLRVREGRFRAYMQVESVNDGPICVLLDSSRLF